MARGVRKVVVEPVENDDAQKPDDGSEILVAMKLLRNYRPAAGYDVVTMAEASYPGVGFDHKLWQGTVVKLPESEAKALNKAGIAVREFD